MYRDPVVAEVRAHGARLAEQAGGDVHRLAEYLRRRQADHPQRLVSRHPPPTGSSEPDKPHSPAE